MLSAQSITQAIAITLFLKTATITAPLQMANPIQIDQMEMKDGTAYLSSLTSEISAWHDYSCESELMIFINRKVSKSGCKIYYKEGALRLEIIGGGFRNGSILVKGKDGKVTGQGGPLLGYMKTTLDPDSRTLILPTGRNVLKSDLPGIFAESKDCVQHGSLCRISTKTSIDASSGESVYTLVIFEPNNNTVPFREVLIDADEKIPRRIDLFRNGERISTTIFKNFRKNSGLNDSLFQL